MNWLEKLFIEGQLEIWVPGSSNETLEQILSTPLDVLYVTRHQVEREGVKK